MNGYALQHISVPLLHKPRDVAQRAHGAWHLQLADGATPPHNAGGDRIGCAAIHDHLLEETTQERLALRAAHGALVPERGERVPQRAEGLAQRGWYRHGHGVLGHGAETRVVFLRLL